MGKYTVNNVPAFEARLDSDLDYISKRVKELGEFRALILMGGYGRAEGTALGGKEPFNDYDLLVVGNQSSVPEMVELESELTKKFGMHIDLAYQSIAKLRRAENSLMNYEMKRGHQVVFGEPNILEAMPDHTSIPLTEGTRLLMNRGILFLMEKTSPIYLLKADLAVGDCRLMMEGKYTISYAEKLLISDDDYFKRAIDFKLSGNPDILGDISSDPEATWKRFLYFFYAYESYRMGEEIKDADDYARKQIVPFSFKGAIKTLLYLKRIRFTEPRFELLRALPYYLEGKQETIIGNSEKMVDLWQKVS